MRSDRHSREAKLYYIFLTGLLVLGIVLSMWALRDGSASYWQDRLRVLKTQRLEMARVVDVLNDNSSVVSRVTNKTMTVESLTLSLIEAIRQQSQSMNVDVSALSVGDVKNAQLLRVEFTAVMQKAMDLLALFDAVRVVADWRHLEVRGCTIAKSEHESNLHATCVVDVYYFLRPAL